MDYVKSNRVNTCFRARGGKMISDIVSKIISYQHQEKKIDIISHIIVDKEVKITYQKITLKKENGE